MVSQLSVAVMDSLRDRNAPIITAYELFRLIWDIYENPDQYPVKIVRRVKSPGQLQYKKVIDDLATERFFRPDPDLSKGASYADIGNEVLRISEVADVSAEDIISIVNPFIYISHISAMQRYGITSRQPKTLYFTSPWKNEWRKKARNKTKIDFGFDPDEADLKYFRDLREIKIPEKVRGRKIHVTHSKKIYNSINISESKSRIIDIGDLFVQTIDDFELCGGMAHVIEVWEESAENHADNIINAISSNQTTAIVKVRAGYILNEIVGIHNSRIDSWTKYAQRGGSRRLDTSKPYAENFSEKWMISINA